MPGSTVPVKPGPSQQLSGANLGTDTIVYNQDADNTVWISSVQSVSPGNGTPLAPFSKARWIGKQLWACVDIGVTDNVPLIVTNDVSDLDNVLGAAAAIAAELLVQGVPQVFLNKLLFSFTINTASFVDLDVSTFASLVIQANSGLVTTSNVLLQLDFYEADPTLGGTRWTEFLSIPTQADPTTWVFPLNCSFVRISNIGGFVPFVVVYGSNRVIPGRAMLGFQNLPRVFVGTAPGGGLPAFTQILLPATDGGVNSTKLSGVIQVGVNASNASGQINILMEYLTPGGSLNSFVVGNGTAPFVFETAHPDVPVRWYAYCTVAQAAGYVFALNVTKKSDI